MIDIEAIRTRAEAATPAPWHEAISVSKEAFGIFANSKLVCTCEKPEDNTFVVHAREDIPALIAETKRLQSELDRVTAERDAAVKKACSLCKKYEPTRICASNVGEWCEIFEFTQTWINYVKNRDGRGERSE